MPSGSRTIRLLATGAALVIAVGGTQIGRSKVVWAAESESDGGGAPNDKLAVYLDRKADITAEDSCTPGFLWQGVGNPNSTFQRKRNLDAGMEMAIKGILRQGPDIRSTYVDGDGLVHIEVPAGAQPTNAARAAWNFTYSYDVALDAGNPSLEGFDGQLWIDLDPSNKTKYLRLTLDNGGPVQSIPCGKPHLNGYQWKSGNTVVIGDDEGYDKVTQNSQNYAFYRSLIDTDRHTPGIQPYNYGPAQFDVVLALKRHGGGHDHDDHDGDGGSGGWTILHVVFDVVATPTQTP